MSASSQEPTIREELQSRFPFLREHIRVARERRVFVETPLESFQEVFEHLVTKMGFSILCTITGLDMGEKLGAIYHLARTNGVILSLSTNVSKEIPVIHTITSYFPAADAYERELVDLLGFKVEGLPAGSRYPLPDGWPEGQYPLRKDWKASMLEKDEGKNA